MHVLYAQCIIYLTSSALYMCIQEQLAEGLHMIDFEQLKINNVDLNEKIEERNEEILKLRKKLTSTVQVLAHLKEKLQFSQVSVRNVCKSLIEVCACVCRLRMLQRRMNFTRLIESWSRREMS